MKNLAYWDLRKWLNYKNNELKIWFLRSIISNTFINDNTRLQATIVLNNKLRTFSKVKIRNWCIVTGWAKSVYSKFFLSWIQLKEFASQGLITGLRRRNF